MKSTVQKILAVLVVVLLVAEIIHASKLNQKDSVTLAEKRPLLIWYTDPDIQEYMQQSAEAQKRRLPSMGFRWRRSWYRK